jgi:hypothetical protein
MLWAMQRTRASVIWKRWLRLGGPCIGKEFREVSITNCSAISTGKVQVDSDPLRLKFGS